jgi:hypothetical protein
MTEEHTTITDDIVDDMLFSISERYPKFVDTVKENYPSGESPPWYTILTTIDYYQNLLDGNVN